MSWGVKITQMCLCVDVQLCLIAMTAVMFAQGRTLADQLSYFTMQEKTSKSIFFLKNGCVVLQYINKI